MYNEKPPLTKKKIIEVVLLLVAIVWILLFAFNYIRYVNNKPLLVSFHTHKDYPDGTVDEYVSLGYTYRIYNRVSIAREELVPFWVLREEPQAINDLPKIEQYEIPDNPRHEDSYMGILYYYDKDDRDLLGTYKCINSKLNCFKATTGWDKYGTTIADPLSPRESYTISQIHEKYAFIDDSLPQDVKYGENGYARTIYLYQFSKKDPKILARYGDIKETSYDEREELANYENNKYIVKSYDSDKWGIIKVLDSGEIKEILPFEYESITYDYDTKYYILCKNDVWYVYDLDKEKQLSVESVDVIYDVWVNRNNTYYFKNGRTRTVGTETFTDYAVYRFDGIEFLKQERITAILPRRNYLMYVTSLDNTLHFISYGGVEKYKIKLNFSELKHDKYTHPAFEVYSEDDYAISIIIYDGRDLKYDYDIKTVFVGDWSLNED